MSVESLQKLQWQEQSEFSVQCSQATIESIKGGDLWGASYSHN